LRSIVRERCGALEFPARSVVAREFEEQIAAHPREQMVGIERSFGAELIDEVEPDRRAVRHAERNGAVEFDRGRWDEFGKTVVPCGDPFPVCFLRRSSACHSIAEYCSNRH